MNIEQHSCPICQTALTPNPRYPNYVCKDCFSKASDNNGKKLEFWNVSAGGGFRAEYSDSKKEYNSHTCFINGIECHADEARFGGIVIEIKK